MKVCFKSVDPNYDIHELDIAVNAVATALKDFFKRFPSILTQEQMSEMEEISSKWLVRFSFYYELNYIVGSRIVQ